MPNVVAIKLRYSQKNLWFGVEAVAPSTGDHVIVETERGLEIGLCMAEPTVVEEEDLAAPLKPVLRVADETDLETAQDHSERGEAMLETFVELVHKYNLDMKPVRVEYLFGGDKAVFYFVAEQRVDFRDLVRDLASRFRVRVDMRQIGVRDEARIIGDLGHCGQQLCCARLGGEFQPVSIRMAKEQDLPLNPVKISGVCGRLMCCLRHEFEAYKDFKGRAPKKGSLVETSLGMAKVLGFDTPREVINLRLEDGKYISVPLGVMECNKKEGCCKVSREALESCDDPAIDLALSVSDREDLEKEAAKSAEDAPTPARKERRRSNSKGDSGNKSDKGEKKPSQGKRGGKGRPKKSSGAESKKQNEQTASTPEDAAPTSGRRRRRRRNGSGGSGEGVKKNTPSDKA